MSYAVLMFGSKPIFFEAGDEFYAKNRTNDPLQHWGGGDPDGNGKYVFSNSGNGATWVDTTATYWSAVAHICVIDPTFHKASNGKYYRRFFQSNGITAFKANDTCQKRGATLAVLYDPIDWNATAHFRQQLSSFLANGSATVIPDSFWIDGISITSGIWIMQDGTHF
jgi:hypothetical protein